jgi:penicillin-binding protein 1A
VRAAVARSANAVAVRVAQAVGVERIAGLAHRAGVTTPLPRVPALALGAAALSPLELTAAYAPFANGGRRVTPHLVVRITDAFGREVWTAPAARPAPALDPRDAFLVQSLLRSVVDEGTARGVRRAGIRGPVAGKTGTTNDAADVWFVGFTPTLVAGVWLGSDTPTPLDDGASGGRDAVPVWTQFVRSGWHSPERDTAWTPPAGLERVRIDARTGFLAADWCGESRLEWFKVGSAPTRTCTDAPAVAGGWPTDPMDAADAPDDDATAVSPRPRSADRALPEWVVTLPEVLRGERLPTRAEVEAAARDLARLQARMAVEVARAKGEWERAQREAERELRRAQAEARRAQEAARRARSERLRLDLE